MITAAILAVIVGFFAAILDANRVVAFCAAVVVFPLYAIWIGGGWIADQMEKRR